MGGGFSKKSTLELNLDLFNFLNSYDFIKNTNVEYIVNSRTTLIRIENSFSKRIFIRKKIVSIDPENEKNNLFFKEITKTFNNNLIDFSEYKSDTIYINRLPKILNFKLADNNSIKHVIIQNYRSKLENAFIDSSEISNCVNLKYIQIIDKGLNDIYLSNLNNLQVLNLRNNELDNLDLNNFVNLTQLECQENKLRSLDIGKNVKLNYLNFNNNTLSNIDINKNTNLIGLSCNNNNISNLNLDNSNNLKDLNCNRNNINTLNLSKNNKLESLECSFNKIDQLDLGTSLELTNINCNDNYLTSIDMSKIKNLRSVNCANNKISEININKNLENLFCYNNKIKDLDLSENLEFNRLHIMENNLKKLNLANLKKLKYLFCDDNNLKELIIGSELREFSCRLNFSLKKLVIPFSNKSTIGGGPAAGGVFITRKFAIQIDDYQEEYLVKSWETNNNKIKVIDRAANNGIAMGLLGLFI